MKNLKRALIVRHENQDNVVEYIVKSCETLTELIAELGEDSILEIVNASLEDAARTMHRQFLTHKLRNK